MRTVTITFDGGSQHVYNGVPLDVTPEQMISRVERDFPNKRATNVDGGRSAAPKNEDSNLDPEVARHQNRGDVAVLERPPTKRQQYANIAEKARALEAERDQLHRTTGIAPVEKSKRLRELNAEIMRLNRSLPTEWADVGGVVGNVGGALLGGTAGTAVAPGAGTTAGAFAGSIAGGWVGRLAGAMYDASSQNMSPEDKVAYLNEKAGITSVVIDTAGNLVFWGGGKVLGTLARNTEMGRAFVKQFGAVIERKPKSEVLPGKGRVFAEGEGATTDAELQRAANEASEIMAQGPKVPPKGDLRGEASIMEQRARQVDPQAFTRANEAVEAGIEADLRTFRDSLRGAQSGESPGHTLDKALAAIENRVKASTSPTFEKLAALRGEKLIDVTDMVAAAKRALANDADDRVLTAAQRTFYQDIIKRGDKLSPATAQKLQSIWQARARDLDKAGQPDEEMLKIYSEHASHMRRSLIDGLDRAATDIERQLEMFRGGIGATAQQGDSLAASRAATEAARRRGEGLREKDVLPEDLRGQQKELFGEPQQMEMFSTGDLAMQNQQAVAQNAARRAGIEAAEAAERDAREGAATRAFGPGQQQSMLGEPPKIDPRLPDELRAARDMYREMHENVYSMTGTKALRAADSRGPEHAAATIYATGNTTSIKELDALLRFAERLDDASPQAMRAAHERAKKLGIDAVDDTSLAATIKEVHRGVRAEFFEQNVSNVAELRKLPEKMKKEKFRRTFEALFPESDKAARASIERLSQAAQIAGRAGGQQGTAHGLGMAVGGGGLGYVLGSIPGAVVGATTLYFGPRFLAHAMTNPAYRAVLPRATAELLLIARGGGGATLPGLKELLKKAEADGYNLTVPESVRGILPETGQN